MPTGKDHLPAVQMETSGEGIDEMISNMYVEEASTLIENADTPAARINQRTNKTETILVVDDNADMRNYIRFIVEKSYPVVAAVNGMDALNKIREHKPVLVVSDIMMPMLDGFGLLKEIKQNPQTRNIPVILLSARAGEEARIEGYDGGADDYLAKPFSAKELVARIRAQIKIVAFRRRTEESLRNLFLQAPVAICILQGPSFIVEVANEKILEIWGKNAAQVLNKPLFEGMPDAKGQGYEELLHTVYTTGKRYISPELPIELLRKGVIEQVYTQFVYDAIHDENNDITGVMVVANEITPMVIARQKIEESEKRFRNVANSAPVMIWMTGEDGRSNFFNRAWLNFTGDKSGKEAAENWSGNVFPEDLQPTMDIYMAAFKKHEDFYLEYRLKHRDGQYRWVSSKGVIRTSADGNFEGFIGACMDIHSQKAFAAELEMKVKERTDELTKKNKELQAFAYISSHDMQEPLRKIQTFSSLLMEKEIHNLSQSGKDYFNRIRQTSAKMQLLINDLLAYSRLGSEEKIFKNLDLQHAVNDVKDDMQEIINSKNALIDVNSHDTLSVIPFQFRQLLTNLIGNSLKFSRPGVTPHIKITTDIKQEEKGGLDNFIPGKKYSHIRIEDNGIGFDPQYREKIFEVFKRLHTDQEYTGTGIGLAIVKKIVDNHEGYITANGELNQGAVFDIYIPQ